MKIKIIKGTVSDYTSEEKYDPEGNYYVHYQFTLNEISLFCKTEKEFYIHDGQTVVVNVEEGPTPMQVIGMYNSTKDNSFGKTKGIKAQQPKIEYELIFSSLKEKQRNVHRSHTSNYNNVQRHLSFTLLLENGMELSANTRTGKKLMQGDQLFIYKPKDREGVSEFLNHTTGANSKQTPLLASGLSLLFFLSVTANVWFWEYPWVEKFMVVAVGGVTGVTGLVGGWSEWSNYLFRKRRYEEFIYKVERSQK